MNCNTTDSSTTGLCRISVGYDDGTIETTEWGHDDDMDAVKLPNNVVQDSKTGYLPQVICWRQIDSSCHTFALKNKPAGQTPQTIINQMPTTGAPDGLSTIGLAAATLGLAGLGIAASRRSRSAI